MNSYTLPNLFVIGVHKAGTTSVFEYFKQNSEYIFCPLRKEIHFFTPLIYGDELKHSVKWYSDNFRNGSNHRYRLDVSPSYFYGGEKLIKKVNEMVGQHKCILLLRDPYSRTVSFYHQMKKTLKIPKEETFQLFIEKAIKEYEQWTITRKTTNTPYNRAIRESLYSNYIDPWLHYKSELKIILFEDFIKDPLNIMNNLMNWLNIEFVYNEKLKPYNSSKIYKNKIIHRVALSFFNLGEPFIRKNNHIKSFLSHFYNKFNSEQVESVFLSNSFEGDLENLFLNERINLTRKLSTIVDRYKFDIWKY